MKYSIFILGLFFVFPAFSKKQPLVKSVNPFIGTGGHGHIYPGASLPFGMVQLSPDTRLEGWDGCSGYHHSDSIIYGFSHTHLSGTGIADYNDLLITPFIENPKAKKTYDLASKFSKKNEFAEPGYYEVTFNNKIKTQLTTTTRSGFHAYHFPQSSTSYLSFDLQHRDQLLDVSYAFLSPTKIVGHRVSKAWANEQHFYFTIEFNQPFELVYEGSSKVFPKNQNAILKNTSFRLKFKQPTVLVKVGASFTSIANSQLNLENELPHWNFEQTRKEASSIWEKELSKVIIDETDLNKKTIYYTALYHSFLNPNTYSDVNGEYRGVDGKIHKTATGHTEYTVFSLWDTFRATHPLLNFLQPERSEDFIQTFLNHYQQAGRLPVWELAGNETECMIGYHAAPVILDAFRQKIPMNTSLAAKAMVASGNADVFGLLSYRKYGYVRSEDESEDVSRTLEYAFDDWCTAQMAKIAGDDKNFNNFTQRSYQWMNVFDPKSLFFIGKSNAGFDPLFDPAEVNFHYTEANAWQYSMFLPHHYREYAQLAGGNEKVLQHLNQLFTTDSKTNGREQADITGLIGQYAHGNEPSHHMAYFYHVLNSFEKGSKMVHQILKTQYHNQPDGLSGNEDCGQMSSWYNWSALGLYPFCPGDGNLVTSLPLFKKSTIQLPNGKKLIIKNSVKAGFDAQPFFNGKALPTPFLSHEELRLGGTLEFRKKSGAQIATTEKENPSIHYVATPVVRAPSMTFTESISIQFESIQNLPLLVSTDGRNGRH
jgi:predicted alpha-1,2-mannosidase